MAVKNEFDINDFSMKGLRKVANENGKELLKGKSVSEREESGSFRGKRGGRTE